MPYNIINYDGSPLASVSDGSLDTTSTSITLVGPKSVNFGLAVNENFVALMEHFANTSPPPAPVVGQIWFDTTNSTLKVWDGAMQWLQISPAFDGNAGTAAIAIDSTTEVMLMLSAGHIIAAVSYSDISQASLPTSAIIADGSYQIASIFPNGLVAGMTLSSNANNFQFNGNATSANVLLTGRMISLSGSVTGNILFDGSNDVVMSTTLPTVFNVNISPGWYSNVFVSGNGLVTDGTYIGSTDVINALGFTPPSQIIINGDVAGNTTSNGTIFTANLYLSNTSVTPGSYTNVTVDATGRVIAGDNTNPIPVQGMIIWPNTGLIPNNWALCDGTTVTTASGTITTPDMRPYAIGPTSFIMRVS